MFTNVGFFYFWLILLFLICQGLGGLSLRAILFARRGVITSQNPGIFLLASVFCWVDFKKNKSAPTNCY